VEKAATSLRIQNIKNVRFENVTINGQLMPENPPETPKEPEKPKA
jgi:hypothetical protein